MNMMNNQMGMQGKGMFNQIQMPNQMNQMNMPNQMGMFNQIGMQNNNNNQMNMQGQMGMQQPGMGFMSGFGYQQQNFGQQKINF